MNLGPTPPTAPPAPRPHRAALDRKFLEQADGDPIRAGHLRIAHFQRLALKSAQSRRRLLNAAGVGSTIFTSATPKVSSATAADSFYNRIVSAANTIHVTRFLPATAVILHPTRWAWVLEALDSTTRPLVISEGSSFNPAGTSAGVVAQGSAGTIARLPVYLDANITTTTGAGAATNQDLAYVLRAPDLSLWESDLAIESFDSTYADQASVLFRCLAYSACIPDRFAGSVNLISGTGLVAPTL